MIAGLTAALPGGLASFGVGTRSSKEDSEESEDEERDGEEWREDGEAEGNIAG